MKECQKCKEVKDESNFSRKGSNRDGLQRECKSCHSAYLKLHYAANKSYYVKKARVNKISQFIKNRQFVTAYLLQHPCIDCGETDPLVLDFDHIRGEKLNSVSVLATSLGVSIDRVAAEIEKCEVRCANCHRRKTAKQFGWYGYEIPPAVQSLRKTGGQAVL